MAPPIVKQIELLSETLANIIQFLDEQSFNERPHVISLQKFPEKQIELVQVLDDYFIDKSFIYPVYILSQVTDYPTRLTLIQELSEVPRYYKQKSKQLNIKENLVFSKIKLKQNQLTNINMLEIKPILDQYAYDHKIIYEKECFNEFLTDVIRGIRNKNELK